MAGEESRLALFRDRHRRRDCRPPPLLADFGGAGMNPFHRLKIVSQLLDLPIIDKDERSCGIVDDVELSGGAGKETRIKALPVGPGAYAGRMPAGLYWLVRKVAGDRIVRVPADQVM